MIGLADEVFHHLIVNLVKEDIAPMHLVQMVGRTNAVVVVAQRLSLLGWKLQGTGGFWSIEPYMQENLPFYTKQHPVLTVCLIFRGSRQGQRIRAYFFNVHQLIALFELRSILEGVAHALANLKIAKVDGIERQ